MSVSVEALQRLAIEVTRDVPDGEPLDPLSRALIQVGVAASCTSLDASALDSAISTALSCGATAAQIEEVVSLVSALGLHSQMVALPALARLTGAEDPLDADQQALWAKHVGDDPYWRDFEWYLPGFLEALLRFSPESFVAFFAVCAVPYAKRAVRGRVKELIAMAVDASPGHRFEPGFRLHLATAVKLGATRRAIFETLELARNTPPHSGFSLSTPLLTPR